MDNNVLNFLFHSKCKLTQYLTTENILKPPTLRFVCVPLQEIFTARENDLHSPNLEMEELEMGRSTWPRGYKFLATLATHLTFRDNISLTNECDSQGQPSTNHTSNTTTCHLPVSPGQPFPAAGLDNFHLVTFKATISTFTNKYGGRGWNC
jgi:hypothetical protein